MQTREIGQISVREPQAGENPDSQFEYIDMVASSIRRDSHGTCIDEETLKDWARAFKEDGIQLKDSHDQAQGFGVSTDGEYRDGKLYGTFKILKGVRLSNASLPTSDEFLKLLDAGIIRKASVAFTGGEYICNICNEDALRSPSCNHWTDFKYDVKIGDNTEEKLCTYVIKGSRIIETSLVAAGSNEDAVILAKAQRCFDEGTLPVEIKNRFERVHNYRFVDGKTVKSINKTNEKKDGGSKVDTKQLEEQLAKVTEERDTYKGQLEEQQSLVEDGKEARKYMSGQASEAFKISRGKDVKETDIEKFNTRAEKMTFADLVDETTHLRSLAPEKPEVDPGSKTSQPDNSGDENKNEQTRSGPVNPAHWGVNYG